MYLPATTGQTWRQDVRDNTIRGSIVLHFFFICMSPFHHEFKGNKDKSYFLSASKEKSDSSISIQLGELEPDSVEWIAILPGRRNKVNDNRRLFIYLNSFFLKIILFYCHFCQCREQNQTKKNKNFSHQNRNKCYKNNSYLWNCVILQINLKKGNERKYIKVVICYIVYFYYILDS